MELLAQLSFCVSSFLCCPDPSQEKHNSMWSECAPMCMRTCTDVQTYLYLNTHRDTHIYMYTLTPEIQIQSSVLCMINTVANSCPAAHKKIGVREAKSQSILQPVFTLLRFLHPLNCLSIYMLCTRPYTYVIDICTDMKLLFKTFIFWDLDLIQR